ncbi:hypothetical protein O181_003225 [Austropuccinia psidii MF-1]|uniref:Transposable element Tc1 transposase n=1 Tax=Austropuccinia psidii MF-1 TaxID=1389203 RepID=A0A9Q3GDP0_9BASI|nr:hypothetical protein [Austropuccinia psidii MF-1]
MDTFNSQRDLLENLMAIVFNGDILADCRTMGHYLDEGMRGMIIGMRKGGASIRVISNQLGVPSTTVFDTIKQYEETGQLTNQPIPGRPKKLGERDMRQLSRVLHQHRRANLDSIRNLITVDVSASTLRKAIHSLGKKSCIAVKKPYLSERHMQRRLAFAQEHAHWTVDDWRRVIWTDESLFELGKRSTQVQVWRTPQEKYDLESLTVNHRSGRRSVMIWGAFCSLFQSQIIIPPPGQRRAQDFINNVYEPGLLPFLNYLNENVAINPDELILMEDGAPIHTAQVSEAWRQQHGIRKLRWPANSPDLNPIENIWFKMKYSVIHFFQPRTMEELVAAIHAVWATIPIEFLDRLVTSMPERIQSVIAKNGAPTRW